MVSTWSMIRNAVFVSALATSVELAQTSGGAVRHFIARDLHKFGHNGTPDSARTITCPSAADDRRVCILATRNAPIGVVIIAARVEILTPPKLRQQAQKKGPTQHTQCTTGNMHIARLAHHLDSVLPTPIFTPTVRSTFHILNIPFPSLIPPLHILHYRGVHDHV